MASWMELSAEDEAGIAAKIQTTPTALVIRLGEVAINRCSGAEGGKYFLGVANEKGRVLLRLRFAADGPFVLPKPSAKVYKLNFKQLLPAKEYKQEACDAKLDEEGALIVTLPLNFDLKDHSRTKAAAVLAPRKGAQA